MKSIALILLLYINTIGSDLEIKSEKKSLKIREKRQFGGGCGNGGYVCNGGPCGTNGATCAGKYQCMGTCCCLVPELVNISVPVWQWPNGQYAGGAYPGQLCTGGPCQVNGATCNGDFQCIGTCCCLVPKLVNISIPYWRWPFGGK